MEAIMLVLKCLTNLHVGDGEVNYNIIDNEVERDPVTSYPTIHASGVKGALRAFLEENEKRDEWFGAGKEKQQAGKLKIFNASLLAIPLRTTQGSEPYCLIYTETMKKQYQELSRVFGLKSLLGEESSVNKELKAEGYPLKKKSVLCVNGSPYDLYQMEERDFHTCDLPVIARNKLDNGRSANLWYEEVVPHKSIFYIPVIADEKDRELLDSFKEAVNGKVIQFGGHASIGYGLCKVFVEDKKDEQN